MTSSITIAMNITANRKYGNLELLSFYFPDDNMHLDFCYSDSDPMKLKRLFSL